MWTSLLRQSISYLRVSTKPMQVHRYSHCLLPLFCGFFRELGRVSSGSLVFFT